MSIKTRTRRKALSLFLILVMLVSIFSINAIAEDPVKDTAEITEKSAKWVDLEKYLAELTLSVNGTQVLSPLDVVICLDRSGSMDMNYIQQGPQGNPNVGTHFASCPCLNQNHFYLRPIKYNVPEPTGASSTSDIIDNGDGTVTVYNDEIAAILEFIADSSAFVDDKNKPYSITTLYKDLRGIDVPDKEKTTRKNAAQASLRASSSAMAFMITEEMEENGLSAGEISPWVTLSASPEHVYFEMSGDDSMELAMYHFELDTSGNLSRISEWITTDVRMGVRRLGIWDHAIEGRGCYDRWTEAKTAIVDFTKELLNAHPDNNVALVPFSFRDSSMPNTMDHSSYTYQNQWLTDNGYDITDSYSVSWTDEASEINDQLPRLFTTANTDYMYALSGAYNMLQERTDTAKATKHAVVVFLSDGKAYSENTVSYEVVKGNSMIASFANLAVNIDAITDAIKSTEANEHAMWANISGGYQRHDVNPDYLIKDNEGKIIGAPGQGAQMVTVGYMLDASASIDRLRKMASNTECYIDIPAQQVGSSAGYLSEMLLDATIFPGGRDSVLRDKISEFFYIPIDEVVNDGRTLKMPDGTTKLLPDGVYVEGTIAEGQTLIWEIGDIYKFTKDLSITIPLVLREDYREVGSHEDYPTNDDTDEPGAELEYTDPDGNRRWHKKKTPTLPIEPTVTPPVEETPPVKESPSPPPPVVVTPPEETPPEETPPEETPPEETPPEETPPEETPAETPPEETPPEETPEPTIPGVPPGYVPGGSDPEAPAPSLPDRILVPGDDNTFVEFDEDGVPLGTWHWDDESDTWIFDEITPLGDFEPPSTHDTNAIFAYCALFALSAAFALLALLTRRKKRSQH